METSQCALEICRSPVFKWLKWKAWPPKTNFQLPNSGHHLEVGLGFNACAQNSAVIIKPSLSLPLVCVVLVLFCFCLFVFVLFCFVFVFFLGGGGICNVCYINPHAVKRRVVGKMGGGFLMFTISFTEWRWDHICWRNESGGYNTCRSSRCYQKILPQQNEGCHGNSGDSQIICFGRPEQHTSHVCVIVCHLINNTNYHMPYFCWEVFCAKKQI